MPALLIPFVSIMAVPKKCKSLVPNSIVVGAIITGAAVILVAAADYRSCTKWTGSMLLLVFSTNLCYSSSYL